MDLFGLLTIGQAVKVIMYDDEINAVPTHLTTIGTIIGVVNDFYRVDFDGIIETVEYLKLEAVL